jgi:hypothetical protein
MERNIPNLYVISIPWRPFEDQHDETGSLHANLLVKRFKSETDVRNILLRLFVVLAAA